MRTEEEIREKIKIYLETKKKAIKDNFKSQYILTCGALSALEWVLESEATND